MRITHKEKKDDGEVFTMKMGYGELEMLHGLVKEAWDKLPKNIFELQPLRNRMHFMLNQFGKVVQEHREGVDGKYTIGDYISKKSHE